MGKFIMLLIITMFIAEAKVPVPCNDEAKMLKEKKIELDTKTLKGWVRLLNNRSKMGEYGMTLTASEVRDLIKCLTEEMENRKQEGKMR